MICAFCDWQTTVVKDTRFDKKLCLVTRRRYCSRCKLSFVTHERFVHQTRPTKLNQDFVLKQPVVQQQIARMNYAEFLKKMNVNLGDRMEKK